MTSFSISKNREIFRAIWIGVIISILSQFEGWSKLIVFGGILLLAIIFRKVAPRQTDSDIDIQSY